MIVACWSAKGGSGTTVVAAGLASMLARGRSSPCRLVDLAGDLPSVLGLPEPALGITDWLASGAPPDALRRLEVEVVPGLSLLPKGSASPTPADGERVLDALTAGPARTTVVDCGLLAEPDGVAGQATVSLLVTRPCYLSLRRAVAAPVRPSGVVVFVDGDRSLRMRDIESVLDAPVTAVVPWRSAIARSVDAGVLGRRLPADLSRSLRGALGLVTRAAA